MSPIANKRAMPNVALIAVVANHKMISRKISKAVKGSRIVNTTIRKNNILTG